MLPPLRLTTVRALDLLPRASCLPVCTSAVVGYRSLSDTTTRRLRPQNLSDVSRVQSRGLSTMGRIIKSDPTIPSGNGGLNPNTEPDPRGPRSASTLSLDTSQLSVLHAPLQPHTTPDDRVHPTGFFRDGYCWGAEEDPGQHYVAGIVTREFLEMSRRSGNDLSTARPAMGFPGLEEGCRWCLCVERWKEALVASERLGERVVPRVDLAATALDTLRSIRLEDLMRFRWRGNEESGGQ